MKSEIERPSPKLLLILLPAVISSAITSNSYITAIPCLLLILASYFNPFYFPKNSFKSTLACLGIFGVSLVIHLFVITDLPTGNGPHVMAASMIVLMVYLWYYQNPKATGNIITLLSLLVLIFTGNNMDNGQSPYPYLIIFLTFCTVLFLLSTGKKIFSKINTFISIFAIIAIVLISFALNKFLFIAESTINMLMQDSGVFTQNLSTTGLSSQFSIESHVKLKTSNKAVILLESKKKLNYLRADVLTHYAKKSWKIADIKMNHPAKSELFGKQVLSFDEQSINELKDYRTINYGNIKLLEKQGGFLPLPPYTRAFSGDNLFIKAFYTIENKSSLTSFDFYGTTDNIPAVIIDSSQTEVSDDISRELKPLTLSLVKGAVGNLQKAKIIENYFHNNYTYSLEVNFDPDKEPIVDFVLNNKKGFCAHFASGMVLMLRSIGVPSHVVSGYYVSEYSPSLGEYIVRERDAHAWVEVLDEKNKQWVTFDSTPINQMNAYLGAKTSVKDNLDLYLKVFWARIKQFFAYFSAESVNKIVFSPVTYLLAGILLLYYAYKKYRQKASAKKPAEAKDINIELLSNDFNKLLERYNIKFKENMTYGELLSEIINSEEVPVGIKPKFIEIIEIYQKYRYTSARSEADFHRIEALIHENLFVKK
jgi:transglutaminase-like putative cysteine protease